MTWHASGETNQFVPCQNFQVPFPCADDTKITCAVSVLCTRAKKAAAMDFTKLVGMMKFLSSMVTETLSLSADKGVSVVEWHVDASFAVHPDFWSHTVR